jgi:hypothetical protein
MARKRLAHAAKTARPERAQAARRSLSVTKNIAGVATLRSVLGFGDVNRTHGEANGSSIPIRHLHRPEYDLGEERRALAAV